jgi:hypothetical protein
MVRLTELQDTQSEAAYDDVFEEKQRVLQHDANQLEYAARTVG